MVVTPPYPGVYIEEIYIEEIPSRARAITGVATSIAAFVSTFEPGPLNAALHFDFQCDYGGLDRKSETSSANSSIMAAKNAGSRASPRPAVHRPGGRRRPRGNTGTLENAAPVRPQGSDLPDEDAAFRIAISIEGARSGLLIGRQERDGDFLVETCDAV
jgi:hypothetical protein